MPEPLTPGFPCCSPPPVPASGWRASSLQGRQKARTQQPCFPCHLLSLHILPQSKEAMSSCSPSSYNCKALSLSSHVTQDPAGLGFRISVAFASWVEDDLPLHTHTTPSPFAHFHSCSFLLLLNQVYVYVLVFLIYFGFWRLSFLPYVCAFVFCSCTKFLVVPPDFFAIPPFSLTSLLPSFRNYLSRLHCVPTLAEHWGHST